MTNRTSSVLASFALLLLAGCATFGHGRSAPRLLGAYAARLAITGRSTYTGMLTIARWSGDSAFGTLKLVAPLAVDVAARGRQLTDTLYLLGTYSAANGCTGTMDASLSVGEGAGRASGPVTLNDKCVGALRGLMEVSR